MLSCARVVRSQDHPEAHTMSITLDVHVRTSTGKGAARKARQTGLIPAVVYGPETEPVSLNIDPDALTRIFQKTRNRNTIVDLAFDGQTLPTLVREVQRHPVSRKVLHADFFHVTSSRKVEVMVPITTTGRPKGAILGGRLRLIRRQVKVRCNYDAIPENFTVDISPMEIGDMVKASEIPTPDGVELVYDNDFNVLTVYGKRVKTAK
jgi:large subunit ribosomal protein L25